MSPRTRFATLLLVVFLIAGCSGDDGAADEPTGTAAASATTESTTTTAAPTTTAATTTTTTEPAGPDRFDEIEALIEAYLASWETKDEEALRASVADNFIVNEDIYSLQGRLEHIRDDADGVVSVGFDHDYWQTEIVGEPVVTGDGPWTVAYRELWQQSNPYLLDGIATYVVIVDDDGALKILNHTWVGIKTWED
jgi:hypothetical protein